jgi:uncharacterized Tic20 family protein
MFKKESGNYQLGIKLANITWALVTLIPIIGMFFVMIVSYSTLRVGLFVLFILLTLINLVIHKRACNRCKMRFICPASMAKK